MQLLSNTSTALAAFFMGVCRRTFFKHSPMFEIVILFIVLQMALVAQTYPVFYISVIFMIFIRLYYDFTAGNDWVNKNDENYTGTFPDPFPTGETYATQRFFSIYATYTAAAAEAPASNATPIIF